MKYFCLLFIFFNLANARNTSVKYTAPNFNLKNSKTCLKKLRYLVRNPSFNKSTKTSPKTFVGSYRGEEGVFFEDLDENFRFISNITKGLPKVIRANENEYYKIEKIKKKLIVKRLLNTKEKANHIALPVKPDGDFISSLSSLVSMYSKDLIIELKKQNKRKKKYSKYDASGLPEFATLKFCIKTTELSGNKSLKKQLERDIKKISKFSAADKLTKKSTTKSYKD
jgi:hypothetical protein